MLFTMVQLSYSVDSRVMLKANLAELGTITSSFPKFGKRTVNSWFSSIVLGLFVMTTFWRIPFTRFEFLNRLYGFSLCPNDSLIFIYLGLLKLNNKYVFIKMVSIAMMIGGAVVNALAFTGSIFLFSSHWKERKRHDLAQEQLTKARDEWSKERVKYLDYINDRLRKEAIAKIPLPI